MAIRQGTTPTHTFTVPFDTSNIRTVHIAYAQCDDVLFIKSGENVTLEGNTIVTTLTQEETLMINPDKVVAIQVRVVTDADDALASDIILVAADKCLEKEVLE